MESIEFNCVVHSAKLLLNCKKESSSALKSAEYCVSYDRHFRKK